MGDLRPGNVAQASVATRETNGTSPRNQRAPLDAAIQRAADHLVGLQYPEGYWCGELEANCSIHAEYLLLTHFLGVGDPVRWRKIVNYLRAHQHRDGGWPVWYGGPGDLNIAVEAYFAMKVAGVDPNDPAMARAREFILAKGGVANTRVFTKMWLALFGQWDWKGTPVLPAEVMLLPNWFPFNVYEFASWARATIVACMLLLTLKPVCPVPDHARIDELYSLGRSRTRYTYGKKGRLLSWNGFFRLTDATLRLLDRSPWRPFRKAALRKAERWLLDRQESDGSWGGIQPPWVYALMSFKALGYPLDHSVMKKGLEGFKDFARETEQMYWTDPCVSPVWDTCLAALALQDAGLPKSHPALAKAADWLLKRQVLDHGGDWQVKRPKTPPGGWPFEFHNNTYPDVDDSAMVLIALHKMGWDQDPRMRQALDRGVRWSVEMESKKGGWGSFDADNTKWWVTNIPFCDFGSVQDPPTEDVTAHMVEMLGRLGYDRKTRPVQRSVALLKKWQKPDGSWWGRWGVNYVYGLGAVLPALKWAGEDMAQPYIRNAVRWLEEHQNGDGGWGEGCESYADHSKAGRGPSTASQTGWGLLALIAAGEAGGSTAGKGVEYLVRMQKPDGSWDEPWFTGTGFPTDFMINYHLYREYWPLMALGQYRQAVAELEGKKHG